MTDRPGFAPERFTTMNLKSMYQSVRASVLRTFEALGDQLKGLPDEAMEDAEALLAVQDRVLERLAPLRSGKLAASRIRDRKSTRLNSSHSQISYAVFCLKKKKKTSTRPRMRPTIVTCVA